MSAKSGKSLQDQITTVNTDLTWEYTTVSTNAITTGVIRLWRQGSVKRIQLSGAIKPILTAGTEITIATIPEGFRPTYVYDKNIVYRADNSFTAIGRITIQADGIFKFVPYTVLNGGVIYVDEIFL